MTADTGTRAARERGAALLVVLMATTLLMGLGAGLTLLAVTEARLAAHFEAGIEALYAADAALERAMSDVAAADDWAEVASGPLRSTFVDGESAGRRDAGGGVQLDLTEATNVERCGVPDPCGDAEARVPWRLYAHGPIYGLRSGAAATSRVYVIVWVAPTDPASSADVLLLRARAYGPYGARRAVEAALARAGPRPRLLAWREL